MHAVSYAQLLSASQSLVDAAGIAPDVNPNPAGQWRAMAEAAESLAGTTPDPAANPSISGYAARTATALESIAGTSGAEENPNETGVLKRIVDALEVQAEGTTEGPLGTRLVAAAAAATFGESLGPELIQNGDMGSDVGWTLNDQGGLAVVAISGGKLNVDDSVNEIGGSAEQVPTLDAGLYRLAFTIDSISGSGSEEVVPTVGGGNGTARNAPGTYEEDVMSAGDDLFVLGFSFGTVCQIDNVSLKKVL